MNKLKIGVITAAILFLLPSTFRLAFCASADSKTAKKYVLDNGFKVLVQEVPESPLVAIDVLAKTGSVTEGPYLGAGISHLLEHMFFKGTPTYAPGEIPKAIRALGGVINASTSFDRTLFTVEVPGKQFEEALNVLSDMLLHPAFDEDEFKKEKEVILNEIRLHNDNPERKFSELIFQSVYLRHPYRYPIIGYEDMFRALSRDDLIAYYHAKYVPRNMILSVSGKVTKQQVKNAAEKTFGSMPPGKVVLRNIPPEPPQIAPRFTHKYYPTEITRLAVAYPGVALTHKDMYALDVLSMILGQGRSSRLYEDLVVDKNIVHSISVSNYTPVDQGFFEVTAVLDEKNTERAISEIKKEIKRVQEHGITKNELEKAKRQVLSQYLFSRQHAAGMSAGMALDEAFLGDFLFDKKYIEAANAVTRGDVQRVAQKYLIERVQNIVILSPEKYQNTLAQKNSSELIPQVQKVDMPNGLTVLLFHDSRHPLVSINIFLKGGLRLESERNNGISNLMADLWTRGTSRRTGSQIAQAIESHGARLGAFSGKNSFGLRLNLLSEDFVYGLNLFEDIVKNPRFPQEEFTREKQKVMNQILAQNDSIFKMTSQRLKEELFKTHPYRMDELGTLKSIENLTQDDIASFYAALCHPENMVIAVYGDIDTDEAMREINKRFLNLTPGKISYPIFPVTPVKSVVAQMRMPKEQAVVMVGFQGPSFYADDSYGTEVLTSVLGSSLSGRLFTRVREEFGKAYTVSGAYVPGIDTGIIYFYAATDDKDIEHVKELILDELARIKREGITQKELDDTKRYLISLKDMSLEADADRAFANGLDELYGLGYNHYKEYKGRIGKVTLEDVLRIAKTYLNTEHMATVITRPEEGSAPQNTD